VVQDRDDVRREWRGWERSLQAAPAGYLGSTAGIADDGTFVAMVRYESEAAARVIDAVSPGAERWRRATRRLGGYTVVDSTSTDVWNRGGSDTAGFVQIREGVSDDPARLRDLYVNQQPVRMGPYRPEVLGGMFAWYGDGQFTLSAYFTSEEEARSGENLHEFESFFADISAVMQDVRFIDLHEPWLSTARVLSPV
jgi:hypothetical protein